MKRFTNTGALFRFALRRDRIFLPLWIVGIVFFTVICAPLFTQIAQSPADLAMYAETMKNPAMIALCGPLYAEPYTYGVMYTQMMAVWILILIGVMNFFLVSRHMRRDEEDGKIEVLRSLPVGRGAILSSTLSVAVLANVAIGLLCAIGLAAYGIESMTIGGCLLLGTIFCVVGLLFSAIAMLVSQLCSTSRSVIGGSFLTLGVLYMLAAMGNVQGGVLSYISPLAIVFKTLPFAGNQIYPIFIILAETFVVAVIAICLNAVRDLGAGLLPQRKGCAHANQMLSSPFGLAWRLTKNTSIAWGIIMFVVGLMYGSVFGDFESFIGGSEMIQKIIAAGAGGDMMLSFMTYITLIMANVAAIPVINCVLKLRSEEKKNRLEPVYAKAVSKTGQFIPYIAIGVCLSVLLQLSLSFGLWLAIRSVMSEPFALADIIIAGIIKLPGIWLLAGLAVLLTGLLPKRTSLVWVYFGLSFFAVYIGRLADLPDAFVKITAFGALPDCPIDRFDAVPFVIMTGVAVILTVAGMVLYSQRELRYS
ncbi:MAG: hypothetical protein LBS74_00240 [Oscillospiraceae bacterium]|jgi:ABC-2 type transport system permease protein|nr:hypothetical protein [Oscillospiraceae bacterium]